MTARRKMKRVLVINTVSFARNGITNVILNLFREMDPSAVHMDFVAAGSQLDAALQAEVEAAGSQFFVLRRSFRQLPAYFSRLRALAKGYDAIHVHGNSATMAIELLAARLAGVPLRIAHSHNTTCSAKAADKLLRPLFYRLCNGRLACGEAAGQWLFPGREFLVIQNGIDCEAYRFQPERRSAIRAALGWESQKIIGHVGRMNQQKNHAFLISAFARLYRQDPACRLLLVGTGDLREAVLTRIHDLGLDSAVHLAGEVSNTADYLSAMDLIAMPSLYEGLPLTLVEEQASGLPCIVSDVITREADKTGTLRFLPLSGGPKAWADYLDSLSLPQDRAALSQRNIQLITASGYSIQSQSQKLARYYTNRTEGEQ